jgi:hypothetical protein
VSKKWLVGLTVCCWLLPAVVLVSVFSARPFETGDVAPVVGTFMIFGSFVGGGVCGGLAIRLGLLGAAAAIGTLANVWLAFVTVLELNSL